MPSSALQKKGDKLSKLLGIDSGPSTKIIATMQSRINNPLFRLSMTDYEDICGNKMMIKLMAKVIDCEEKQLKKFCKYINVFAENIKSSPKSIKKKMKVANSISASKRRGSLHLLPEDILEKIVEKYKKTFKTKYVLKDWVLELDDEDYGVYLDDIDWESLSSNPNAIDLLQKYSYKINWSWLSGNTNPRAIEMLKTHSHSIDWRVLSANPAAIDMLKSKIEKESKMNERQLEKLKDKIDWDMLSQNPNPEAIKILKANPDNINLDFLSANPSAIDILKANVDDISWYELSANTNPEAIELLKTKFYKINWELLSANPAGIDLLKTYPGNIKWNYLSQNPNAIKMLKKKIDEENKMSEYKLEDLEDFQKISWEMLSSNPNAIDLLEANKNKTRLRWLSENPAIFDEILV
jgi:methionine-rich copper-binding protein CopC